MIGRIGLIAAIALAQANPAPPPQPPKELKLLQGRWALVSFNGETLPAGGPDSAFVFTGDQFETTLGGELNEKGTVILDAARRPWTLDFQLTRGTYTRPIQACIAQISGDRLTLHCNQPGDVDRPADFTRRDGFYLYVARKRTKQEDRPR